MIQSQWIPISRVHRVSPHSHLVIAGWGGCEWCLDCLSTRIFSIYIRLLCMGLMSLPARPQAARRLAGAEKQLHASVRNSWLIDIERMNECLSRKDSSASRHGDHLVQSPIFNLLFELRYACQRFIWMSDCIINLLPKVGLDITAT